MKLNFTGIFSRPHLVSPYDRAYATVLCLSVVCRRRLYGMYWLDGASWSKSYYWQRHIWEIDWY